MVVSGVAHRIQRSVGSLDPVVAARDALRRDGLRSLRPVPSVLGELRVHRHRRVGALEDPGAVLAPVAHHDESVGLPKSEWICGGLMRIPLTK